MSSYTRVNWQNSPNTATPLSAENLNKMDAGIEKNADDIEELQRHTYDAELDGTSTNAPQTKAVYEALQQINVETDTTLSVAGKAADAAATGEAVADVKSAINELLPIDLAKKTTYTTGKGVQYNNGNLRNSSGASATDYIDITGISSITYTKIGFASTSDVTGIAFYDASKVYISGVRVSRGVSNPGYRISVEEVPENAVYVRLTKVNSWGDVHLYGTADYVTKVYPRVEVLESDSAKTKTDINYINTYLSDVGKDGYFKLDPSKWESGGYQAYNSPDSRLFRVRYTEPLTFDHDIYIVADIGFYAIAWKPDGTYFAASSALRIPANTTFKLYCRRVYENTDEVADVPTFANAIKLSTALAPIELYKPTFTDISMFERVGVCGDSYANGGGIISGIRSLTWGKNLERQAGISVDIYAKSGQNITEWNTDTVNGLPALLGGPECGLYWLQHGINGTGSAAAIGTPEDMETTPHPTTFYGQYAEALEQIKTTFPNARIIIATIIGTGFDLYETNYSAVNTAIRNIAEYCGVMLVDVADDDFYRSDFYTVWNRSNHPTAMQCAGIAMANRRLISKCIQDNPSYFVNYGAQS